MTKEERKEYNRRYYERNKEKNLEEYRERYANDKDYRKDRIERASFYNEMNKDKIKTRKAKYYEDHKEECKSYFEKYYSLNRDALNHKRKYKYRKEKILTQSDCVI